jgi:DNA-binding NarL/FixJ family response regulator
VFQQLVASRGASPNAASRTPPREVVEDIRPGAEVLTPRQREIVALIAQGYTNQRIADALVLTPGTVANHIQRILERLELRSRTQVAVWYAEHDVTRARRGAP